jgi:hypothetical protein
MRCVAHSPRSSCNRRAEEPRVRCMRVCDASTPLSKPEGSGAVGLGLVGCLVLGCGSAYWTKSSYSLRISEILGCLGTHSSQLGFAPDCGRPRHTRCEAMATRMTLLVMSRAHCPIERKKKQKNKRPSPKTHTAHRLPNSRSKDLLISRAHQCPA